MKVVKTWLSEELSCRRRNLSGRLATGNHGEPGGLRGAANQNPSGGNLKICQNH